MAEKPSAPEKIKCIVSGIASTAVSILDARFLEFVDVPMDVEKMMDIPDESAQMILCGPPPESVSPVELAQLLRMKFQLAPIFLVVDGASRLDRKIFIKNGFSDVFFLPLDKEVFITAVARAIEAQLNLGKTFRSVRVGDMEAGSTVSFDTFVYLPMNNKHVKFTRTGEALPQSKVDKLKTKNMQSLFVSERDMPKFYSYAAENLKKMGSNETMSETEKSEKLKGSIRDIFTGMFSDTSTGTEGGKKIVEDCQKIVKAYVTGGKPGTPFDRIQKLSSEGGDSYSHVANVSTYAAMVAIGLNLKTVEDIALAGLLHDIGLSKIPMEVQNKPAKDRTPEEELIYQGHVEGSISMIQDRKLVVSELVYKIIQQHHERFDGNGYPKKIPGLRFCQEAQILAFADLFDELTAVTAGQARKSVDEVVGIFQKMITDPSGMKFDPVLLKKILALFPKPASDSQAA